MLHWGVSLYKYMCALTKHTEYELQQIFRLCFYWSGSTEAQSFEMCNTEMLISVFSFQKVPCADKRLHLLKYYTSNFKVAYLCFTFFILHFISSLHVKGSMCQIFSLKHFNEERTEYEEIPVLTLCQRHQSIILQRYPMKLA